MAGASNISQLRITIFAGLALLAIASGVMIFFYFYERSAHASVRQQDSFNRLLAEYDLTAGGFSFSQSEIEFLGRQLDNLEKRAITVESWLSILKRRKALADINAPSLENYRKSIENAINAFPLSQPVIAVACSFYAKHTRITGDIEIQIRNWLPFLIDSQYIRMRLSLHVILGDFTSPQSASYLPVNIFETPFNWYSYTDGFFSKGAESIFADLAVMKTIKGDYRGAAADIQTILGILENRTGANNGVALSDLTLRFAAEYHYDFGDLLRSALIFSLINSESAFIRQADALYLAGYYDTAQVIWKILSEPVNGQFTQANETSLYNLAAISADQNDSFSYLEKLVNSSFTGENNKTRSDAWQFGVIRYSRFLDYSKAAAFLNASGGSNSSYPYIDLEICKRLSQEQNPGRQLAQTWLLLDRYEKNKDLHNWAAWLFLFQRNYSEADILLERFERYKFTDTWADVYRAIRLMNKGDLDAAENIFNSVVMHDENWAVNANTGRILEAALSPLKAIEQYDLAAEKIDLSSVLNKKKAAAIQIRAARCLKSINRIQDARFALQYALSLDPENLQARMELDRLL
ncbi:MAG: hypothetical protein FWC17_02680 [Treponema sp.]|nr:hypothetical protein [Treponema sp.]